MLLNKVSIKYLLLEGCHMHLRSYTFAIVLVNYSTGGDVTDHKDTHTYVRWPDLISRLRHLYIDVPHHPIQKGFVVSHGKEGFTCRYLQFSEGSHGSYMVRDIIRHGERERVKYR